MWSLSARHGQIICCKKTQKTITSNFRLSTYYFSSFSRGEKARRKKTGPATLNYLLRISIMISVFVCVALGADNCVDNWSMLIIGSPHYHFPFQISRVKCAMHFDLWSILPMVQKEFKNAGKVCDTHVLQVHR